MRSLFGGLICSSCVVLGAAVFVSAQGQPPAAPPAGQQGGPGGRGGAPQPAPKNLKVLPKDWTRRQVGALMDTFVVSLGQQPPAQGAPPAPKGQGEGCLHCHARSTEPAPPGARGPMVDYASDENPKKDVARKMIQMVMDINNTTKDVGDKTVVEKVTCWTCHQGKSQPAILPDAGWGRGGFSLLPAGPPMPPAPPGRGGN